MHTMNRATVFAECVVLLGLSLATGCTVGRSAAHVATAGKIVMMAQGLGPTMTQSTGDHLHAINATIDHDARAFFDDLDLWYQTDRPTRLTRWNDR